MRLLATTTHVYLDRIEDDIFVKFILNKQKLTVKKVDHITSGNYKIKDLFGTFFTSYKNFPVVGDFSWNIDCREMLTEILESHQNFFSIYYLFMDNVTINKTLLQDFIDAWASHLDSKMELYVDNNSKKVPYDIVLRFEKDYNDLWYTSLSALINIIRGGEEYMNYFINEDYDTLFLSFQMDVAYTRMNFINLDDRRYLFSDPLFPIWLCLFLGGTGSFLEYEGIHLIADGPSNYIKQLLSSPFIKFVATVIEYSALPKKFLRSYINLDVDKILCKEFSVENGKSFLQYLGIREYKRKNGSKK